MRAGRVLAGRADHQPVKISARPRGGCIFPIIMNPNFPVPRRPARNATSMALLFIDVNKAY